LDKTKPHTNHLIAVFLISSFSYIYVVFVVYIYYNRHGGRLALYKSSKTFANQKSHIHGIYGLLTIKTRI